MGKLVLQEKLVLQVVKETKVNKAVTVLMASMVRTEEMEEME
jgi:hypothetical protein